MNKALIEDTRAKIDFILSQKINEENKNDSKLTYIIRLLFTNEQKSKGIISFPDIEKEAQNLFCKLIDLIYTLFKMTEKERDQLFRTEVTCINNSNITEMIKELEELQNVEVDLPNEKINNLCEIIMRSLIKKKYKLIEYIDTVLANLSSFPGLITLLNFQVYTIIINKYINLLGIKIDFHETGINLEDEISLEIILDLFQKEQGDDLIIIQSLVILEYNSLRDVIKNYNMPQISNALQNTFIKITTRIDIPRVIYVEKVLMIFREELKNLNSKEKKKKRKNKKKKKNKEFNTNSFNTEPEKEDNSINTTTDKKEQIKPIKNIIENNPEQKTKTLIIKDDKISENISQKILNNSIQIKKEEFKDKIEIKEEEEENNKKIKKGDNLKKYINDLLLKEINFKDNKTIILDELKNIFNNLIDNNDKMEQKLNILIKEKESMQKQINDLVTDKESIQKQINDLSTDKESMENHIQKLENIYTELKKVLGNIQTRDFSKKVLKSFNRYLISDDLEKINKDVDKSQRGIIISERIEKKFYEFKKTEQMKMIANLIKNCSDSINQGNDYSLSMDNYEEDIEKYKKNEKLNVLNYQNIFHFLIGLGITEEYFNESFDFLKRFFDNDMKFQENNEYLESYFK